MRVLIAALAAWLMFCGACLADSDLYEICRTDKANVDPYKTVCPFVLKDQAIRGELDKKTRAQFAQFGPDVAERAVEKTKAGKLRYVRGCQLLTEAMEDFNAAVAGDQAVRKTLKSCADIPNVFHASIAKTIEANGLQFFQVRLLMPSKEDPNDSGLFWMTAGSYQQYQNPE